MSPQLVGSDVRHSSHVCLPFETIPEKHEATVSFIHEYLMAFSMRLSNTRSSLSASPRMIGSFLTLSRR